MTFSLLLLLQFYLSWQRCPRENVYAWVTSPQMSLERNRVMVMFDLSGRRFLITGAGSAQGIGFAAARALHQLGALVFLTSLSPRVHDRARELNVFGATSDLTNPDEVRTLVTTAVEKLGGLEGLVNNAGM